MVLPVLVQGHRKKLHAKKQKKLVAASVLEVQEEERKEPLRLPLPRNRKERSVDVQVQVLALVTPRKMTA